MATPYLCGNSQPCPACALQRAAFAALILRPELRCNLCSGRGYLPLSGAAIVAAMVAEARAWHWRLDPVARHAG